MNNFFFNNSKRPVIIKRKVERKINNVTYNKNVTEKINVVNSTISKPRVWGPTTWMLFHTLAEKIKEEHFSTYRNIILKFIINICSCLPCPTCREDATNFFKKLNLNFIKTKNDLKLFLYNFHNRINKKTFKPIKDISILDNFKTLDIYKTVILWSKYFNTFNSEAHEFMEQLQRDNIKESLINFITKNRAIFN